jgi:hypothetical protein
VTVSPLLAAVIAERNRDGSPRFYGQGRHPALERQRRYLAKLQAAKRALEQAAAEGTAVLRVAELPSEWHITLALPTDDVERAIAGAQGVIDHFERLHGDQLQAFVEILRDRQGRGELIVEPPPARTPALDVLLQRIGDGAYTFDLAGTPHECGSLGWRCPFVTGEHDVNFSDPGEGYYDCSLLDKTEVWGENPPCQADHWRARARAELDGLLTEQHDLQAVLGQHLAP